MDLKDKRKILPSSPGVYLMKDSLGGVIYVGKSKNLKNRVNSYFQNTKSHSPKIIKLVQNLKDFDYILTDTEFEAFMLECKLIKEIKPRYNSLMKSPISYSYFYITLQDNNPEIKIVHNIDKADGNIYFGPYTNINTLEKALQGIQECCKILCNNNSRKASTCLNYSLGLCIGMCLDRTNNKKYIDILEKIVALFKGTDRRILEEMEHAMNVASDKFDFESAAKYRDYIAAVTSLMNKAKVIDFVTKNNNIVLLEKLDSDYAKLFLISGSNILFSEKYEITSYASSELKNIFIANILLYFNNEKNIEIRKEDIDEAQIIYSYLKDEYNDCKYIIIENDWLYSENSLAINTALDKLLYRIPSSN